MRYRLGVAMVTGLSLVGLWAVAVPPDPSSARGFLLVANKGDHTLGIIDPEQGHQIAAINPETWRTDKIIASGPLADGLTWA
jgi:hypothetical protein